MARKGFDEWWMPFVDVAASTVNPWLGAGLTASRTVANNSRSRSGREDASGVYYLLAGITAFAVLGMLFPPNDQPPQ